MLNNEHIAEIIIKVRNSEEEERILECVCNQLRGNLDFKNSNICVNSSGYGRNDLEDTHDIHIEMFNDAESMPPIVIPRINNNSTYINTLSYIMEAYKSLKRFAVSEGFDLALLINDDI